MESKLKEFQLLLEKWNAKTNLVSRNQESFEEHIEDGVTGCLFLADKLKSADVVYDFGSGNGIPGIVLSIVLGKKVVCVESNGKKCAFLENVRIKLGLPVEVKNIRAESLPGHCVFFGVCRGWSSLKESIEILDAICGVGAEIYHFKGPDWEKEAASIQCSTWNIDLVSEYSLKNSQKKRFIVRSTKIQ